MVHWFARLGEASEIEGNKKVFLSKKKIAINIIALCPTHLLIVPSVDQDTEVRGNTPKYGQKQKQASKAQRHQKH